MKYTEVVNLIGIIEKSNFTNFEIDFEETYISLSKESSIVSKTEVITKSEDTIIENKKNPVNKPITILPDEKEEITGNVVKSPIVGTFYESGLQGGSPFVKIGDTVKIGDVLCIIEAMKVMNEVTSKFNGTVKSILISNEDVVEYNQPLFVIE